jgi:probable phosphoglycerate mutase
VSSATIFLVRHGETEWNRSRRYQGWSDSPLTAHGIVQAEAIGRRLRTLPESAAADIVASPLGRARRTAEIIAGCLGRDRPIQFDERLKEISLGSWDGLHRNEIAALSPGIFDRDYFEWYFRTPDGETYDAFAARVGAWLTEDGDGPLIVIAHGIVTRILRGIYAGLPRAVALSLPVPQDRIFRLADGAIEEIAV